MNKYIRNTNQVSAARVEHQSRYAWLLMIAITLMTFLPVETVSAHGERMHSPALRMRSIQFYDVTWQGAGDMKVGDQVTMEGKIYFPSEEFWPHNLQAPSVGYLQTSGPAAVFSKVESYINEVPMVQSGGLSYGSTYNFKIVMQARVPGKWHIHPTVQMVGNGPIVGPGEWTNVTGAFGDAGISGVAGRDKEIIIDDLATYSVDTIVGWHTVWFVMGFIYLLWWVKRPSLLPRYRAVQEGVDKNLLVTRADKRMGVVMLVATVVLTVGGAINADSKHSTVLPLQTGNVPIEPSVIEESHLVVKGIKSIYNVPGRSMSLEISVANNGNKPVKIGEFATAGIRFVMNPATLGGAAGMALEKSIEGYPKEYIREALAIKDGNTSAILPGETRKLTLIAADAVWEVQNLSDIILSPVRRAGGLVFFFDEDGKRHKQYIDTATDVAYR
ncbi:MAG: hypothetical protein A6F70_08985 [Cycloclasticus sp. symbiont of Bathymodiolus heckerae]|nr:MAG: hypothetical protein A6F70_08985 [Cycloclasticus sp. symbiont of Bathymodiolus heckerae]